MNRKECIRDFVQNVLGCTCPDKVFEQIEVRRLVPASSPHTMSIIIGGRLLIYIWYVKGADKLKENFFAMLDAGRKERDENGLKRFRAVLAVDGTAQKIEPDAAVYFSQYAGKDDNIHFHVVSSSGLNDI